MPLVRDFSIGSEARLCLWQITEHEDELPQPSGVDLTAIRSASRRLETKTVYAMLHQVTGCNDLVIGHDSSGRPVIPSAQISISHTRGWAALVLSEKKRVAVDVEYFSDRVLRITDRFLRPDEQRDSVERQLVGWCVKEAVYKYFSEDNLQYFEMRISPYALQEQGSINVDNLKRNTSVEVHYEIHAAYVLAYAVEE